MSTPEPTVGQCLTCSFEPAELLDDDCEFCGRLGDISDFDGLSPSEQILLAGVRKVGAAMSYMSNAILEEFRTHSNPPLEPWALQWSSSIIGQESMRGVVEWISEEPPAQQDLITRFPPSCLVRGFGDGHETGVVADYLADGTLMVKRGPSGTARIPVDPARLRVVGFCGPMSHDWVKKSLAMWEHMKTRAAAGDPESPGKVEAFLKEQAQQETPSK